MSDQNFREIQLSGKQLVFLFMASVVLAVSVFLLGVSVGRGVRDSSLPAVAGGEAAAPTNITPPDVMPAPTAISDRDSAFEQLLPGRSAAGGQIGGDESTPESSVREAPPAVHEPLEVTEAPPARPEPPAAPPAPQTAADRPTPPRERSGAATPARSTAAGQYTVQVNAYRSRASADQEAAALKQKGYDAYVDASAPSGLFRVRVGSYPTRGDADRTAARLRQEGIASLVTR